MKNKYTDHNGIKTNGINLLEHQEKHMTLMEIRAWGPTRGLWCENGAPPTPSDIPIFSCDMLEGMNLPISCFVPLSETKAQ